MNGPKVRQGEPYFGYLGRGCHLCRTMRGSTWVRNRAAGRRYLRGCRPQARSSRVRISLEVVTRAGNGVAIMGATGARAAPTPRNVHATRK